MDIFANIPDIYDIHDFILSWGNALWKTLFQMGAFPILLSAAVLLACGFWTASFMDPEASEQSLVILYLAYGVCCSGGVGLAYNSLLSSILEWFPDRSGMASGILLMGYGVGGMLLGSAVTWSIKKIGLFYMFRCLGCMMPVVVLVGAVIAKAQPSAEKKVNHGETGHDKTTAEMLREKYFWYMMCWLVILGSIGLLVVNSAATIVAAFGAPEIIGLLVSVFNGAGRIVMGTVYDRFKGKIAFYLNSCIFLTAGILLCIGGTTGQILLVIAGLALAGSGYGGDPTIASAVVRDTYGRKYYSVNFAIVNLTMIPSSIIGPLISSRLIERSNGGYDSTFFFAVILALAALVLCFLMHRRGGQE